MDGVYKPFRELFKSKRVQGKPSPHTHFSLGWSGGGKFGLIVPETQNTEFLQHYANAWEQGTPLYLSQRAPKDLFPFFLDLDIYYTSMFEDNVVQETTLDQLFQTIQTVLRRDFKGNDRLTAFVAYAAPEQSKVVSIEGEDTPLMKLGIHVHYPNLFVQTETALDIRTHLIDTLKNDLGNVLNEHWGETDQWTLQNDWETIIDLGVIKNRQLRMLGSRKIKKCGQCTRKTLPHQRTCAHPNNVHYQAEVDVGRVYEHTTMFVYDCFGNQNHEERDRCRSNKLYALQQCDVRRVGELTETSHEFEHIPSHKRKKGESNGKLNDNQLELLEGYIEIVFQTTIVHSSIKRTRTSLTVTLNSQYCFNHQGDHNSAGTYVHITRTRAARRCFCQCDREELLGKCRDVQTWVPFPPRLGTILFGNQKTRRKKLHLTPSMLLKHGEFQKIHLDLGMFFRRESTETPD
jgi:hypothetical protein